MRRDDSSPQAYVADVEGEKREMLETIRALIREVAPGIAEGIRHGMLDYPGLCNLAAQKNYVSVYTNMDVVSRHKHLLRGISCGKSCIRYRRKEQIQPAALRKILQEVRALRA